MSTLNIILIFFFSVITFAAGLDILWQFRKVRRLRQAQICNARSLRQAVNAMGPFPERPDIEVLSNSPETQ